MRLIGSILVVKNRGSIATLPGASVHPATVAAMEPPLVSGIGGSAASRSVIISMVRRNLRRVPEAEKRWIQRVGRDPCGPFGGCTVASLCRI
jgi:hypothetical protein